MGASRARDRAATGTAPVPGALQGPGGPGRGPRERAPYRNHDFWNSRKFLGIEVHSPEWDSGCELSSLCI